MRTIILIALMMTVSASKAQTLLPGGVIDNSYRGSFSNNFHDSSYQKKWSFTRFSAISVSYAFFGGGNAAIFSAPVGLQLNRRLNNNLYAFANVSVAPTYISFNRSFIANDFKTNQGNNSFQPGNLGAYSRAALGLMYINDEKTFSISGSISVERSSYPLFQYNQADNNRANHVISGNR